MDNTPLDKSSRYYPPASEYAPQCTQRFSDLTKDQLDNNAIVWVNNAPQPRYGGPMGKAQLTQLFSAGLSMPYKGTYAPEEDAYIIEDEYDGKTIGEVIVMKRLQKAAEGDPDATRDILDRVMGKPKQSVESTSVTMSYSDFLEMSANEEDELNVIDITPAPPTHPGPPNYPSPFGDDLGI